MIEALLRNDLILLDEVGFAPLDDTGAQLLFRFVSAAYERRALDRLLHHANVVVTSGDSYRMRQARAKGGTTLKEN